MSINNIEELYEITRDELENKYGSIFVNFNNRNVRYTGNDVVGNCLQEWLPNWFEYMGVDIIPNESTQEFPDFVARFTNTHNDVEIKCWNASGSPAFDLANFNSYVRTLYIDPRKLNADYFILGYRPTDPDVDFAEGFQVTNVYLKKIWEMTGPTRISNKPISIQVKYNRPYAIRPTSFHRNTTTVFNSRLDFVIAIKESLDLFPQDEFTSDEWFNHVKETYESMCGEAL